MEGPSETMPRLKVSANSQARAQCQSRAKARPGPPGSVIQVFDVAAGEQRPALVDVRRDPGVVAVDGVHFAVANGLAAAVGDDVTLAIRPSAVRIIADGTDAPVSNVIRGRLIGQAYLGDQQDLRLEVSGGNTVRALAPSHLLFPAGAETLLHFPPQDCRVVRN